MARQKQRDKVIGSRRQRKQVRKHTPQVTTTLTFDAKGIDDEHHDKLEVTIAQRRHVVSAEVTPSKVNVEVSLTGVPAHKQAIVLGKLDQGISRDIQFRMMKTADQLV